LPIIAALLAAGAYFLFRLAYIKFPYSTALGLLYAFACYGFVRARYEVRPPLVLPLLAVAAVQVDATGNYFDLYNQRLPLLQYDEIAHLMTPALTTPIVVWLLREGLRRRGHELPPGLVTCFAVTTMFTIAGFYEVLELWDDKYMHPEPGMRIHGPYDTANDLQWNLLGMGIGALATYAAFKIPESARPPRAARPGRS